MLSLKFIERIPQSSLPGIVGFKKFLVENKNMRLWVTQH